MINKIKESFADIAPESQLGKIGQKMVRENQEILDRFIAGVRAAADNAAYIENTTDEGGVKKMIREVSFSETDFREISIKLQHMSPVAELTGEEFPNDGTPLNKRILDYFNDLGNNVYSEIFGDVALNNSSVHDDMAHGKTKYKIASYKAVPEVIKNGVVVDSQRRGNGNYDRIVIAAPITISDEPYLMGGMLQRDKQTQRLYLHDVVAISKIETTKVGEVTPSTTETATLNDSLYMASILQRAYNVKENTPSNENNTGMNQSRDDDYLSAANRGDMEIAGWVGGASRKKG